MIDTRQGISEVEAKRLIEESHRLPSLEIRTIDSRVEDVERDAIAFHEKQFQVRDLFDEKPENLRGHQFRLSALGVPYTIDPESSHVMKWYAPNRTEDSSFTDRNLSEDGIFLAGTGNEYLVVFSFTWVFSYDISTNPSGDHFISGDISGGGESGYYWDHCATVTGGYTIATDFIKKKGSMSIPSIVTGGGSGVGGRIDNVGAMGTLEISNAYICAVEIRR